MEESIPEWNRQQRWVETLQRGPAATCLNARRSHLHHKEIKRASQVSSVSTVRVMLDVILPENCLKCNLQSLCSYLTCFRKQPTCITDCQSTLNEYTYICIWLGLATLHWKGIHKSHWAPPRRHWSFRQIPEGSHDPHLDKEYHHTK